jgi:AcrR family transcriptional regulator
MMAAMETAPPPLRHRKPTEVRRGEIADAAMRVMATQGTRGFTARVLAREVGITDGAVFRHFPSMEAIVDAVVERMEAVLFAGLPPAGGDPVERLGVFFRRRVVAIGEHPDLSRLLLSDHLAQLGSPAHAERVAGFKRRTREFVRGCLRQAARSGRLRPPMTPEVGVVLVSGAILSLTHANPRPGDAAALARLADEVWGALEAALTGAAPAGAKRPRSRAARAEGGRR